MTFAPLQASFIRTMTWAFISAYIHTAFSLLLITSLLSKQRTQSLLFSSLFLVLAEFIPILGDEIANLSVREQNKSNFSFTENFPALRLDYLGIVIPLLYYRTWEDGSVPFPITALVLAIRALVSVISWSQLKFHEVTLVRTRSTTRQCVRFTRQNRSWEGISYLEDWEVINRFKWFHQMYDKHEVSISQYMTFGSFSHFKGMK